MANVLKLYYVDTGGTYKQWELLPNKLLVVDSIADYLATKTALTINNFQYIKNELEIGVNVDLTQSYSQPKATTSFKYVSVQNDGEAIHYYFVKKIIWRSKSAVRFELVMDVLNTFKEGTDYVFKENTRIIREHKNRFAIKNTIITIDKTMVDYNGSLNVGDEVTLEDNTGVQIARGPILFFDPDKCTIQDESDSTAEYMAKAIDEGETPFIIKKNNANYEEVYIDNYSFSYNLMRNIDFMSEGINPILNHGDEETLEESDSVLNQDWYLLYRNQNDPSESQATSLVNPVDCFLIPENATKTNSGYIQNGRLVPSFLEEGKYYYFILYSGVTFTLSNGVVYSYTGYDRNAILITKAGNKISAMHMILNNNSEVYMQNSYDDLDYIDISPVPIYYCISTTFLKNASNTLYNYLSTHGTDYTFDNSGSYNEIDPITTLDRTDAKNIKLIKLPYCPYDFTISGGIIQIAGSPIWELASITQAGGGPIHVLKLLKLSTDLKHDIETDLTPFEKLYKGIYSPAATDLRKPLSDEMESKLFHSDFYNPSFVYDSFSIKVDLEKCDLDYYITNDKESATTIQFMMTKTINSKFMFTLTDYKSLLAESNFYKILPIARNNEEVLYNVPYINYIRTGYQYDVKNKNISTISNAIGLGLSVASIGASLLAPSVPLKVAGIVASLVSVATSIKNTVVSEMNNSNSIKQKQEQYRNQAASVVGSDDVDLMSEYCDNRVKYFIYKPTALMCGLLNDLFFYAGYTSNRMGKPTHNNRVNFDYLECEASIEKVASIPDECLNELINCFKAGVCYIHKTWRASDKWDFAQKYENWESNLFN